VQQSEERDLVSSSHSQSETDVAFLQKRVSLLSLVLLSIQVSGFTMSVLGGAARGVLKPVVRPVCRRNDAGGLSPGIAVGTAVASRPPHRSVREALSRALGEVR
jgi:hypothetical protein